MLHTHPQSPPARTSRLAALVEIRPATFRQKAIKLKAFVRFLRREYGGSLKRMFSTPTAELRELLLSVHGIGPETADSILLYAGNHPVFVVDAYTHRIFERHGITRGKPDYEAVRALFEGALPRDARLFNEFHALVVNTGKKWCRKRVILTSAQNVRLVHCCLAASAFAVTLADSSR